ncbi:ATP-binding cassette domain-containing protein [Plebeiibacterium marinum]|uniref:ATP-binding cassette domain-containing protein n=1 Tax=Plebeiibacterium marinum TaxID=2992111 RepID=A0AAE3MDR0_9BACT|nr:ATP-binding cassette domain-containing protein [Plebeiobacterium marinum]MCW3805918.1 ATP-binding cassette domain-containing protein [Plebeiobacterium marinum]
MIVCNKLSLSFDRIPVFRDLSFEIYKGEFVTVNAASGKGKTSLLKILQGYVLPASGTVLINGVELGEHTINKIREQIIWIPQNVNLPVDCGMELIEMLNLKSNINSIKQVLDKLGLDSDFLSKSFKKISGGQKQRVVVAICLGINRPLVLMDEPTSSLDEESIKMLLDVVKSTGDKTFFTASHNKTWMEHSDRIIELG